MNKAPSPFRPGKEENLLHIRLLDQLSLRMGAASVDDSSGHSKKTWLALVCLICSQGRTVTRQELTDLLWPGGRQPSNLANAMKTTLYRVRGCLDSLYPGAGHQLVVSQPGGYAWNTQVPAWLDLAEFERLCASDNPEEQLQATGLFGQGFVPKLQAEPWAGEKARQLLSAYLAAVQTGLGFLEAQGRWQQAADLAGQALKLAPLDQSLYCRRMKALLQLGQPLAATQVYEDMNQLFLSQAGALPGDEAQAIYRQAASALNTGAVASAAILDQLAETYSTGAYFCEYDVFRALYRLQVRDSARSGEETSLAVFTAVHRQGGELNQRSLNLVMGNLLRLLLPMLRNGDAVSRCSASQYVLLLPRASFENSQAVCQRIRKAFQRQYPHSPAALRVTICPLQPGQQTALPVES